MNLDKFICKFWIHLCICKAQQTQNSFTNVLDDNFTIFLRIRLIKFIWKFT